MIHAKAVVIISLKVNDTAPIYIQLISMYLHTSIQAPDALLQVAHHNSNHGAAHAHAHCNVASMQTTTATINTQDDGDARDEESLLMTCQLSHLHSHRF